MKHFLIYLLLFLPISLLSQDFKIAGGTSTITVVTPDTVWMAADSKRSFGKPENMAANGYYNKILTKDSVFYMIAGYPFITDTITNKTILDFSSIMIESINRNKNIDSVVEFFKNESFRQLGILIEEAPLFFYRVRDNQNHSIFISVSVTACKSNSLQTRNFNIEFVGSGKEITFKPRNIEYKHSSYLHPMGFYGEILKIRNMPGFSFDYGLMKDSLTYMINLEAAAHQEYVGGTVDVIKIYKGGFKWLTDNIY